MTNEEWAQAFIKATTELDIIEEFDILVEEPEDAFDAAITSVWLKCVID